MPRISYFFGIIITMYFEDHNPPHFHVKYNEQRGIVDIQSLEMLRGNLSERTLRMVIEWASINQDALMENWIRCKSSQNPLEIKGLE